MIPERLYLKGFAGIRAGLGRDELSLDLVQLAGDAELVAFAGPNGTGKTTVLDSLQPYRLLPSRASSLSGPEPPKSRSTPSAWKSCTRPS